jgi:hypothetical protein
MREKVLADLPMHQNIDRQRKLAAREGKQSDLGPQVNLTQHQPFRVVHRRGLVMSLLTEWLGRVQALRLSWFECDRRSGGGSAPRDPEALSPDPSNSGCVPYTP